MKERTGTVNCMIASIVICIIAELIGPLQFKVMGIDVKILTMIWVIIMGILLSPTLLGKVILLILIQIGGLGIIACVTAFFFLLRRQITVRERMVIQETYNADSIGGIVGMVRRILIGTFTVEGVGALFYAVQFVPEYGLLRGIGYSIFHSVSAFCNAGIDILGSDSLAKYICNPLINITTMLLIIISGIGFYVWYDVLGNIKK